MVEEEDTLKKIGIILIFLVNTLTNLLPMDCLSEIQLINRGNRYVVVTNYVDGVTSLLYFTCIDDEHRYLFYCVNPLLRVECMSDKSGGKLT